jgi:GAF domain-containing protein
LRQLMADLERRVVERTRGLQAAADVARTTTSMLDLDTLLRQVVDLVRERFDLYYVGLFLVDEEPGDPGPGFAVLRAGTGEAGQEMLERRHKLAVGGESMIGQCVARSEARIALDVGEEAVRFDNPLLPETRSELALPLRSRGRIIGAMTVQSVEANAFDEAYIAILQTMADQVAVAIDNARLFLETQAALEEMEAIQRRYLGHAWAEYTSTRAISGYRQTGTGITPLRHHILPEVQRAVTEQRPVVWSGSQDDDQDQMEGSSPPTLVVPIMLRDQPIGALGLNKADQQGEWSADDIALAEAIAEQLALAADNLRLLDETQRRAAREQLVGEITGHVRASMDPDTILKTTVRELGRALGARMAEVQVTGLGEDDGGSSRERSTHREEE